MNTPAAAYLALLFGLSSLLISAQNLGNIIQPPPSPKAQPPLAAPNLAASQSPCPRALKINTNYQFMGRLHFICLQAQFNKPPTLDVIDYLTKRRVMSREVGHLDIDQMASFVDNEGTLRILLAVPNQLNGTSMYSIDQTGNFIDEVHTVNAQLVSAMSIWRMELNWEWQLAMANQPNYEILIDNHLTRTRTRAQVPDPKPMISIHSWRYTYFDLSQIIYLPHDGRVNKIEPMHINGQEFLIIAMEPHQALDEQQVDSLIYKLDFGKGNLEWSLYQGLNTHLALDVKSFVISHKDSLQTDYYIALIGQTRADNPNEIYGHSFHNPNNSYPFRAGYNELEMDAHDPHGLVIYKYFGDKFLKTQLVFVPNAIKLDAISYGVGDSYAILAVLMAGSNHINLYLFDGLNLRLVGRPSGPLGRAPPRSASPMNYARQRRTMENTASFRLFHVPAEVDDNNSNTQKRNLIDDVALQSMTMPALAISQTNLDSDDENLGKTEDYTMAINITATNDTSKFETLYQIPIKELIKEEEEGTNKLEQPGDAQQAYLKRNFVGQPVDTAYNLLNWCRAKMGELLSDNMERVSKRMLALPRIDQVRPIELSGDLIIEDDLYVSNLLMVRNVEEANEVGPINQRRIIDTEPSNFSNTFEEIHRAHMEIDAITRQVDQILVDDGTEQDVFHPIQFDTLIVECLSPSNNDPRYVHFPYPPNMGLGACPRVDEISAHWLNGRDITQIETQALITGRNMVITRDVRFEHLVLRGSVEILETINGLHVGDIVFKRGPSTGPIVGHKIFRGGLYSASRLLVDDWDGTRVDRYTVLTSNAPQRIESRLRFARVIIDSILDNKSRIELLNGKIHMDSFLDQIAVSGADHFFSTPLHFEELHLQGPIAFSERSRLCSIDLVDQWHNTMYKQAVQNVTAPMRFLGEVHISYGGDMHVDGLINGFFLNQNNVLMRNRDNIIANPVIFDNELRAGNVQLEEALNGIQVVVDMESRRKELAILYNGGTQLITADKVLSEVRLAGDSNIRGNINGHLNISHLHSLVNANGQPYNFASISLNAPNIRVAEGTQIHIGSTMNGIPAGEVCRLANSLAQKPIGVPLRVQRLRFEDSVRFKSLHCASINGFNNLTRSFLTKMGNQLVEGSLRLHNGAIFNTSVRIDQSLNNLPVGPMAGAIARSVEETRRRHKDVTGDWHVDELIVNRINDLQVANVFLARADTPQYVRAPMTFYHVDMENVLSVSQNFITNWFNDLNVSDILTNTLQYDKPQIILNHVELNTMQLMPNVSFHVKSLNNHELSRLWADAVLKDVPQQILAPKTFRGQVEFLDRLYASHGIDSLNNDELRLLLLQGDEPIDGDLFFTEADQVLIRKDLDIQSGLINDIDVNHFVELMLNEERKSMRLQGNASQRFNTVRLKDLVVLGKIQGIDLSREAVLRSDNLNGTYNMRLEELQDKINNQRLISSKYGPGTTFRVQSRYQKIDHSGQCYMHSCDTRPTTPFPAELYLPPYEPKMLKPQLPSLPPAPINSVPQFIPNFLPSQQPLLARAPNNVVQNFYTPPSRPEPVPQPQMPVKFVQQFYPNILPPEPMSLINTQIRAPSRAPPVTWQPNWAMAWTGPSKQVLVSNFTVTTTTANINTGISAPTQWYPINQYLEYQNRLQSEAIHELARHINPYLSISFYYDIVQKHPLLGPPLHAASNPMPNEQGGALLLLKAISKPGEPCLLRGQSVAVMSKLHPVAAFSQGSLLQETSNPRAADSLYIWQTKRHYLFILDSYPESQAIGMVDQVIIYSWDYKSGMYELTERLVTDGAPTALKAFTLANGIACFAIANPRLVIHSNHSGAPMIYCQQSPLGGPFNRRHVLPLKHVFDFDVASPLPGSQHLIIAALSQKDTEQIGDLQVGTFDTSTGAWQNIAQRRMVRPLKLHLFQDLARPHSIRLAVSEAITSSDDVQAITRLFSLRLPLSNYQSANRFYETQIVRDNQVHNIQSVKLDSRYSLLFFQSMNSISIFAPTSIDYTNAQQQSTNDYDCDDQYSLIQRIPTKGANKFLVFNERIATQNNSSYGGNSRPKPFGHYMVLSRDDCEHQQSSTIILKARFH